MEDSDSTPIHFALLIGVNSDSERPLKGCVRDVRAITKYVIESVAKVHIQLFTADSSTTESENTGPSERLATYSNVKFGLQTILSVAKAGSYVYIHYSGHGVRTEASSKHSNKTTGDLALNVLEDSSQNVTRPFLGLELARILKDMVDKGLVVTLVLDCCFSGSVLRGSSARYREYDSATYSAAFSSLQEAGKEFQDINASNEGNYRDASMLPNWLVDPEGYTVITACGPHEFAFELKLQVGTSDQRHGALSYFLLRAMKKLGGFGGKHAHIYPYLCSMFRQSWPKQNPMWYGNKDLYFFGNATPSAELTGAPLAAIWCGDRLQLQGGQAHGICEGDSFAVYTMSHGRPLVTGIVKKVRPLTSDLEVSDSTRIRHERGCIAKALTKSSLERYLIKLSDGPENSADWHTALDERQGLVSEDGKHPFAFTILADGEEGPYRIRDRFGKETHCSPDALGRSEPMSSPNKVLGVVERLAKYQLVQDLKNDSDDVPFGGHYQVALIDQADESFPAGSTITVKNRAELRLVVNNQGKVDLYVHIYNLGPLGQVQNILKGSYDVVPPRDRANGFTGQWTKQLQTVIPRVLLEKGLDSCEDIIKIFITSQPTSFASLEMQKTDDRQDRGPVEPAVEELGPSVEKEDWVALNFKIRVVM
jgi:hypothetical protein